MAAALFAMALLLAISTVKTFSQAFPLAASPAKQSLGERAL
jgi:hypothetical protein